MYCSYEPLPSYLERFGVDVIWRSNNWGAPSEKVRLYQRSGDIKCKGEKCNHDEVLLEGLTKIIKNSKRNKIFIVLHTAGSHGPTYYKKYPKDVKIIGVSIEQNIPNSKLETFRKEHSANYTLVNSSANRTLVDKVAEELKLGNNFGIPLMVMYKDGKFIKYYQGATEEEFIESDIKRTLGI